jgi:hypothetical protein
MAGAGGGADGDVGEDPEAVHDQAVKARGVLMEPAPEAGGEAETAEPALSESVNRKIERGKEGRVGRILTKDFDIDTDFAVGAGQLADSFGGSAIGGREASNDVENAHSQRLKAVPV